MSAEAAVPNPKPDALVEYTLPSVSTTICDIAPWGIVRPSPGACFYFYYY